MYKCNKCNIELEVYGEGECKVCGSSLVSVVVIKEEEKKPEKKGK